MWRPQTAPFGFWILDFGLDEALLDIVWILHKIFPCHADSGRRIFNHATERGLSYKGPAVICGDLNVPLESLEAWDSLRNQGWFDAALIDSIKFQRDLQPTSKHGSRHSFVLINRHLATAFYACRTSAHYDFDSHPLLVAGFNIDTLVRPQNLWILPKSFDCFMFDEEEIKRNTKRVTDQRTHLFDAAIEHSNMNEAARQFTIAVEEVFKDSAVNCEGIKEKIPQGHFGRSSESPFVKRTSHVPCVKAARNGDFNPIVSQMTNGLRLHTKQLRRLKALVGQSQAYNNRPSDANRHQCQELWNRVLDAHGFSGGFALWICQNFVHCVPLQIPSVEYIQQLHDIFQDIHNTNLQHFFLSQRRLTRIKLEADIEKGGSACFRDVKDAPVPPIDAIHWNITHEVVRVAWAKEGRTIIPLKETSTFRLDTPVYFQNQKRYIQKANGKHIELDEPVKLRDPNDMFIKQENASSEPDTMQDQLAIFWKTLWQRDDANPSNQNWDNADAFVTCLNDCPTCNYAPIDSSRWFASLKGVSKKSARGADGFSTRDFEKINYELLDWLLKILWKIENNCEWPRQWTISKVTVLGKGPKPKSPLDIRPITILPKIYRLWSRIRSLEVLKHLQGMMPAQISATAGGVSADQVAAFTALAVEDANYHNSEVCGLIIDLIKCYNTIPWEPCKRMLQKMRIPDSYHVPFFNFLKHLGRAFQINNHCGSLITCTTGVPEGCAMSVAIMAAMSLWCYAVVKEKLMNPQPHYVMLIIGA